MSYAAPNSASSPNPSELQKKLWIYTNYDCNLRCTYCVAESSPLTPRRPADIYPKLKLDSQ